MKELLQEMPWIRIGKKCPYCDTPIDVEDYRVELWDEETTSFKRFYMRKLFNDRVVPVLCPNKACPGRTFLFDKKTNIAVKMRPEDNITKLLLKYADKFIISEEYSRANLDGFWVLPNGKLADVGFGGHVRYVESNPKQFGLAKPKQIIDYDYGYYGRLKEGALNAGGVKVDIDANFDNPKTGVEASVQGTERAIKRHATTLYSIMRKFKVKTVLVEDENDEILHDIWQEPIGKFVNEYL